MKSALKAGVALLAVAIAVLLIFRNWSSLDPSAFAINATPTFWVCSKAQCKHEHIVSMGEIRELSKTAKDDFLDCPQCGEHTLERGLPCRFCNRVSVLDGMGRAQAVCPKCGKRSRKDDAHMADKDPAHSKK